MKIPADAVQCNGPLMYDPSRFITADGTMFKTYKTGVKQLVSTNKTFAWSNAKKLVNGEEEQMESIKGFYDLERGTIPRHALVAYYFISKKNPNEMIAEMIDQGQEITPENLKWVRISDVDFVNGFSCSSTTQKGELCKKAGTMRLEGKLHCLTHLKKLTKEKETPKEESLPCAAKTQKGADCRNRGIHTHGDNAYCGLHKKMLAKKMLAK